MNPTKSQIIASRNSAKLTQGAAAQVVGVTLNAWQKWEAGARKMPYAAWELFKIRSNLVPPFTRKRSKKS